MLSRAQTTTQSEKVIFHTSAGKATSCPFSLSRSVLVSLSPMVKTDIVKQFGLRAH